MRPRANWLAVIACLGVLGPCGCSSSRLDRRVLPVTEATSPAPEPNQPERMAELARRGREHPDARILFVGDSITQGFEGAGADVWAERYAPRDALNFGVGGDRTQDVLRRIAEGHFDGLHPAVAVLLIGTNNTGRGDDPVKVADGVAAVVRALREKLPKTRILLLAIFPRGARPEDPMRLNNVQANQLLARIADGDDVVFLDIGAAFLAPDGALPADVMPDQLHLSDRGYRIWAASMEPLLAELLAR